MLNARTTSIFKLLMLFSILIISNSNNFDIKIAIFKTYSQHILENTFVGLIYQTLTTLHFFNFTYRIRIIIILNKRTLFHWYLCF